MFECHLCGEYTAPTKGAVKGHISGKSDSAHAGKSGPDEADNIKHVNNGDGSADTAPQQAQQAEQAAEQQAGSNPVLEGPEPTQPMTHSQQPAEPDSGENEGEYCCLSCGGEVYDFTEYDTGKMYDIDGTDVFVAGDYQCSQCGEWFVNE